MIHSKPGMEEHTPVASVHTTQPGRLHRQPNPSSGFKCSLNTQIFTTYRLRYKKNADPRLSFTPPPPLVGSRVRDCDWEGGREGGRGYSGCEGGCHGPQKGSFGGKTRELGGGGKRKVQNLHSSRTDR